MRFVKIFVVAVVALLSTTLVAEAQQYTAHYAFGDSPNKIADSVNFDINAPVLTEGDGKLYHIRKINLHGVKYLNHDIHTWAAGLQ